MKYIISLIVLLTTFTACTLETSDNGDLDGMWQLYQLETLEDGNITDMRSSGIYWSVQKDLMELTAKKGGASNVLCRFNNTGNTLTLSDFYIGTTKVDDVSKLSFYYIEELEQVFNIELLKSWEMIIYTENYKLYFRKY